MTISYAGQKLPAGRTTTERSKGSVRVFTSRLREEISLWRDAFASAGPVISVALLIAVRVGICATAGAAVRTTPVANAASRVESSIYYVDSENGRDSNIGRTVGEPWRTLASVNRVGHEPGTTILFRRGYDSTRSASLLGLGGGWWYRSSWLGYSK